MTGILLCWRHPLPLRRQSASTGRMSFLPAGEANLKQDSKVMLGLVQPFPKARLGVRLGGISNGRMRLAEIKTLADVWLFVPPT